MNTVLAIDDDKTTLGLLESQLTSSGFNVSTVSSASKGIEIAKSFNPDVILLDLMMPGLDGFGVISALHRDKITRDIPVIILTSKHDRETVIDAMRRGVIDYIVKPYNLEKLVSKIKAAITYSGVKKQENEDAFIEINHRGDMAVIVMKGNLLDHGFQNDVKTVFNAFFLKQVHGRVCVFDLRSIEELNDAAMKELMIILTLFAGSKIKIVAGRHYGEIVSMADIEDKAELFLSFGDLELSVGIT